MANLINSIRNKSNDHTLKGGLKDKNKVICEAVENIKYNLFLISGKFNGI